MTIKTSKAGQVVLACEGITVVGEMCVGTILAPVPGKDPETKMPLTKTARNKAGRAKAAETGWRVTKGADECPKVHSQVPVPVKAKDRVEEGAPPCNHDQRAGIVTNQPGKYDRERPHVSVTVCGDPACRAASLGYVLAKTGEHPTYLSDSRAAA